MVRVITTIMLLSLTLGCSDPQLQQCSSNSIEDIDWLRKEITDNGYDKPSSIYDVYVYKTSYSLGPVFITTICCPACSVLAPEVKNCMGKKIGTLGVDIDNSILNNAKIIWRTHNGVCL